MKANQTKVKKKGRTVRAFKRDLSLWLFCVPGVVLTFIFSYIPMYGIQLAFRCESRYPGKPVGRSLLLPEVLLIPVFRNDNQEHVDPESVWTARIFPASDHPGSDAELSPVQKIP